MFSLRSNGLAAARWRKKFGAAMGFKMLSIDKQNYGNVMHKVKSNYVFSVVKIFAAVILLSIIIFYLSMWLLWSDSAATYWFQSLQGVGSIGAVLGAFYVGEKQADATRQSINEAHKLEMNAKKKIFSPLYNRFRNIVQK